MAQRSITEPEIDQALANPSLTYDSKDHADRRVVQGWTDGGRVLKVVVLKADPEFVVTVSDTANTI